MSNFLDLEDDDLFSPSVKFRKNQKSTHLPDQNLLGKKPGIIISNNSKIIPNLAEIKAKELLSNNHINSDNFLIPPKNSFSPDNKNLSTPTFKNHTNNVNNKGVHSKTGRLNGLNYTSTKPYKPFSNSKKNDMLNNEIPSSIPETNISMASIPVLPNIIKSNSSNNRFITLSDSDDENNEKNSSDFDEFEKLKFDKDSKNNISHSPSLSNFNENSLSRNSLENENKAIKFTNTLNQNNASDKFVKSNLDNLLVISDDEDDEINFRRRTKQIQHNSERESNDDDDDDDDDDNDIQITHIKKIHDDSSFPKNENMPNILPNHSLKRPLQDINEDLEQKRQLIRKQKEKTIQDNIQRQNQIQDQMKLQFREEKAKQEKERIAKLLAPFGTLKKLPEKYRIVPPIKSDFQVESFPQLPNSVTAFELSQEIGSIFPDQFKAYVFRNEHLQSMNSVVHRIRKLTELHSKLDDVLKNTAIMKNQVAEKAKANRFNKKAEIRYHQILRFFSSKINILSKYYGNIGNIIANLKKQKQMIFQRAGIMENIRREFIFMKRLPHSFPAAILSARPPDENILIVNVVTTMYQLSDVSNARKEIIYYKSIPPIPNIILPDYVTNQNQHPHVVEIESDDDDFDAQRIYDDNGISSGSNHYNFLEGSRPIFHNANIIGPPYTDQDEGEHIKNLMESIKPDMQEYEEKGLISTPAELVSPLYKYQRIGVSWMIDLEKSKNRGGILADAMGLGKTIQAMSVILANKPETEDPKLNLIVGPVSLLHQWMDEFRNKIKPTEQVCTYLFHSKNKLKTFKELVKYDVVLVSYQTLGSEWKKHCYGRSDLDEDFTFIKKSALDAKYKSYNSPFYSKDSMFYRIILDEAQYIKNKNTVASKAVASLSSKYRWCLSGTPIQNKLEELYPLIRFLHIKPYNDWPKFNSSILTASKRGSGKHAYQRIHAVLSAILLRRTKDTVIDGQKILHLKEKHIHEERVEMGEEETEFYKSLENQSARAASKLLNGAARSYSSILTLLLRMRQACDHQYLVRLGDDGDRTARLERFSKGFEALKEYADGVFDRIDENSENGFVCINCREELAPEQTLLLSKCGHPVCYDCHMEFFTDNSETVFDGNISAKCLECGVINLSSMSVDFRLYEAYKNGKTWIEIRKMFDLDSKASDRNWRLENIQNFIAKDGKMLVSAKMKKTLEIIQNIISTKPDDKVIVFSQFLGFFDILRIILHENSIDYLQYDGSMDIHTKNECVNIFKTNPNKKVMLISLKAGNAGLTLTAANHVIIVEPFWNPYVEKQAQDRVHRISQEKEVHIHRLLIGKTVEDRIMELQKKKEELVEGALDPNLRSTVSKLGRKDLGFLFGLNGLSALEND